MFSNVFLACASKSDGNWAPGHSQLCPETKLIRPHLELTTWVQLFALEQPRDLGIPSSASGMAQSKKEPLPQCGSRQI